jgi:hypothetical protein
MRTRVPGEDRAVAYRREQEVMEATHQQEEEAVMFVLQVELRALRDIDPGMTLLKAVEFVTLTLPAALLSMDAVVPRIGGVNGLGQDDPRLLKIASSVAMDLVLLLCRAKAEGFQR